MSNPLPYPENADQFNQVTPEDAAAAVSSFLAANWPRSVDIEDWYPDWINTQLLRFFKGEAHGG